MNLLFSQRMRALCGTLLFTAATALPGLAAEPPGQPLQIEKITVTAHKQAQKPEDIPDSLTVLNDIFLEDGQIDGMDDLSAHVPSLEFSSFGSRRHSLVFMRGIKSLHTGEPATGYYVDGVNYAKSYMFDFPLFDVERIEILKGPQGTLYGKNTMGGVINVHTRQPDNTMRGEIGLSAGDDDFGEIKGSLSAPLIKDRLFVGLAGIGSTRDGYMENTVAAEGEDGRHWEGGAGRLKLRYTPSDRLEMALTLDGQSYDGGAFPFRKTERHAMVKAGRLAADAPYHYSNDFEGSAEDRFWGGALNMVYRGQAGTWTAVTGYRDYDDDEFVDVDFTRFDLMRMRYEQAEQSFSQELRFAAAPSDLPLTWMAGAYTFFNDTENHLTHFFRLGMAGKPGNPFGAGTGNRKVRSEGENRGYALFGQATYTFVDRLDLTLGLRWEHEDAEMDRTRTMTPDGGSSTDTVFPHAENDFSALLPKASLTWHLTPAHMLYTTYAGGQRSGGFNTVAPSGDYGFDEETSHLYEVGTKLAFFDRRLGINLSGFYMEIEDEQITLFDASTNSPYTVNAGESHRLGMEAELQVSLAPGLDINAGICLLEAEYDRYNDPTAGFDYEGNTVFGVPQYTFNIGVQYRRPLWHQWDFFGRIDLLGVGRRYFDDANHVEGDAYQRVNLKVGVEGEILEAYIWSQNLFDEEYVAFENTKKGIAEDGEPRTVGVSLNIRF